MVSRPDDSLELQTVISISQLEPPHLNVPLGTPGLFKEQGDLLPGTERMERAVGEEIREVMWALLFRVGKAIYRDFGYFE